MPSHELRLPIDSPLERSFRRSADSSFRAALALSFPAFFLGGTPALVGLFLGFVLPGVIGLSLLARATDCAYVLDGKVRGVEYSRRLGEREYRTTVCHRTEVELVTVQGQFLRIPQAGGEWTYRTVLLRKDGRVLPVTSWRPDFAASEAAAASFAEILAVPHLPARDCSVLMVSPGEAGPEASHEEKAELPDTTVRGIALTEEPLALQEEELLRQGADVIPWLLASTLPLFVWALPAALAGAGWELALAASVPLLLMAPRPLEVVRTLRSGSNLSLRRLPDPSQLENAFVLEFLALEEEQRTTLLDEVEGRAVTCPYCNTPLRTDEAVACLDCETLHHRDCWREAIECTTYACGGRRSAPLLPETASSRK